jgi:hypothetical protein
MQQGDAFVGHGAGTITYIDCPCCGCLGACSDEHGFFQDGQGLLCGCAGSVHCDSENPADISLNGDECSETARCKGGHE